MVEFQLLAALWGTKIMKQLAIIILFAASAFAQQPTILTGNRGIDWTGVGATITDRMTSCASLTSADSVATINAAIAACTTGQVVDFAAGTYTINANLWVQKTNITLRGAGPLATILNFSGASVGFRVAPSGYRYEGSPEVQPGGSKSATWATGFTRGTTSITLTERAPSVGEILVLDQKNLIEGEDTGGLYICNENPECSINTGTATGRNIGGVKYSQQQLVKVVSVSGSGPYTVTITPPLRASNWNANGQTMGAWWPVTINEVGIEDMTLDYSGITTGADALLLQNCQGCWIKNIRSIGGRRNHVRLYLSRASTVRDSYFYGAYTPGGTYGVEEWEGSDNLIENNICNGTNSCFITGSSQGTVVGYNYSVNHSFTSANWMIAAIFSHDASRLYFLAEGNDFQGAQSDTFHGFTGGLDTYFRNRLRGQDTPAKTQNTNAVQFMAGSRGNNLFGNVLGTASYHTSYQILPPSTTGCFVNIYQNGYGYQTCGTSSASADPPDEQPISLFRWANYDVVNAAVRSEASEVPSAVGAAYIDDADVPMDNTLPDSFYLAAEPDFWGTPPGVTTPPWPPIGPDVTSGDGPGGFSYKIPAQLCLDNTALDEAYAGVGDIIAFDATDCYYTAAPMGEPILRVTTSSTTGRQGLGSWTVTMTVSNEGDGATSGTVTLTAIAPPPGAATITGMSGTGWTCSMIPVCTRSDALSASTSYPAVTVTFSLAKVTPATLSFGGTASGGGGTVFNATNGTVTVNPFQGLGLVP